jgi:hypothetical protein
VHKLLSRLLLGVPAFDAAFDAHLLLPLQRPVHALAAASDAQMLPA